MRILKKERVLIFITMCPVILMPLVYLPNNKIRFNCRVTVRLGLLEQLVFFGDIL